MPEQFLAEQTSAHSAVVTLADGRPVADLTRDAEGRWHTTLRVGAVFVPRSMSAELAPALSVQQAVQDLAWWGRDLVWTHDQ